jgi:hypothetical protein
MRSNVKPAPVVVDHKYSGSDAFAKLPTQAEDTPKPVMCCSRLETSMETSDDCAVPPPQVVGAASAAASLLCWVVPASLPEPLDASELVVEPAELALEPEEFVLESEVEPAPGLPPGELEAVSVPASATSFVRLPGDPHAVIAIRRAGRPTMEGVRMGDP